MKQHYEQYTALDHRVWSILYNRQLSIINETAFAGFEKGLEHLNFQPDRIPDFTEVNQRLKHLTGWKLYAVPGLIDNNFFFQEMAKRKFGATTWLRTMEQLDYLEEPDMFHDVFGHVPLLANPSICNYLFDLASVASCYAEQEDIIEKIARLYWFTIEFGLVKENGNLKIYGAGILSSPGETKFCMSDEAVRVPFDLKTVIETPYIKDKFQQQYFVLSSMQQLEEIGEELNAYLYKLTLV